MHPLTVTKKTGYKIKRPETPVVIRDFRGVLFYSTETLTPKVKEFNLPPGQYFIDSGVFYEMPEPVKYRLLPLPKSERNFSSPFDFKFTFGNNPHKATINFLNRTIFMDNSFREKSLPEIYFVLFHEFAHQYFKTEKYTDVLASNYMLLRGFNPSQIGRAHIMSLSNRQLDRKKFNVNHLIECNFDHVG